METTMEIDDKVKGKGTSEQPEADKTEIVPSRFLKTEKGGLLHHDEDEPSLEMGKFKASTVVDLSETARRKAEKDMLKKLQGFAFPGNIWTTTGPYGVSVLGESPIKDPFVRAVKDKVWKKSYRKAYKKLAGRKPDSIPPRPKLSKIQGGAYRILGMGVRARGFEPHSAGKIAGGAILSTILGIAAPLVIKGIVSLGQYIAKKIRERKEKKSQAPTGGAAPTPDQIAQATEAAAKISKTGRVGFPNPYSFPATRPMPRPDNAADVMRGALAKAKDSLYKIAEHSGLHPLHSARFINRFIRKSAKDVFGKGAAKMLLDTRKKTKPLGKPTAYKLLAPVLAKGIPKPGRKLLRQYLKDPTLRGKLKGVGSLLRSLSGFILDESVPKGSGVKLSLPTAAMLCSDLGRFFAKLSAEHIPGAHPGKLAIYLGESLKSGLIPEGTPEEGERLDHEDFIRGSGSVMTLIKGLARLGIERVLPYITDFLKSYVSSKEAKDLIDAAGDIVLEKAKKKLAPSEEKPGEKPAAKPGEKPAEKKSLPPPMTKSEYEKIVDAAKIGSNLAMQAYFPSRGRGVRARGISGRGSEEEESPERATIPDAYSPGEEELEPEEKPRRKYKLRYSGGELRATSVRRLSKKIKDET